MSTTPAKKQEKVYSPKERISRTRFGFLLHHPFLGDLSLRLLVAENVEVPTMATDSRHLLFNPKFVDGLDNETLMGIIAHEIAHCVFNHSGKAGVERAKHFHAEVWRMACEYMANHFVLDICSTGINGNNDFKMKLPEGVFYDIKYSDGNWTTEEIYHDLMKSDKVKFGTITVSESGEIFINGKSAGKMTDDHSRWGQGGDKENDKEGEGGKEGEGVGTEQDWKIWVAQAAQSAKRQGKLPAGLERFVDDILDSQINWRQVLAEFVCSRSKDDYSWRRLNKRHMGRGLFAPSLYSEKITGIFYGDTSGSMSEQDLQEALGELKGICTSFQSYLIHVMGGDAKVQSHQVVTPDSHVNAGEFGRGGGGSCLLDLFNKIENGSIIETGDKPDFLVVFTDAYITFPKIEPDYPVLFVVKGEGISQVPWGRKIKYEV